jgi:radical SAM protein (TIGR01212 family)
MQGATPYLPISQYYKKIFGEKVYKIPVAVVDDCPNRRGLKGMQTCIFCDPWGSAANKDMLTQDLKEQIEKSSVRLGQKYNVKSFLVYFQAYTNTFTKLTQMRANFEVATSYPFVKGVVIGTRPDCLSPALFDLWNEYSEKTFISVELGVQSFNDKILQFLRRGHTRTQSLNAIEKIQKNTKVDLGLHFILGNPGETDEDIIEAAQLCNDLGIQNVKLHNLHVLKGTGLEELYYKGKFKPVEFEEYARKVALFLSYLSPDIYVHRLAALSSRPEELIAPSWVALKMATHQKLLDFLNEQGVKQGSKVRYSAF